jgi:hypothetical protein
MLAISLKKHELDALNELIIQIDAVNAAGMNQVFNNNAIRILKFNIIEHLNEIEGGDK